VHIVTQCLRYCDGVDVLLMAVAVLCLCVDDLKQRVLKFDLHPDLIEAVVNTLHAVCVLSIYIILLL